MLPHPKYIGLPLRLPAKPKSADPCAFLKVATAAAFAVTPAELSSRRRGSQAAAFARQSAMYLAHVVCGMSLSAVGEAFGRDRTTVAHACRLVEDCRDNAATDLMLHALEQLCRASGGRP